MYPVNLNYKILHLLLTIILPFPYCVLLCSITCIKIKLYNLFITKIILFYIFVVFLQKMNIFPVRNYTDEVQTNCHMDILILLAIRKMINVAIERIKRNADQDYDDRRKIRCVVN